MTAPQNQSPKPVALRLAWTSLAVLGLSVGGACAARYLFSEGEYRVYSTAARRMLHGTRIYIPNGDPEATTAPFSYPPFFSLTFIPLLPFPWIVQKVLWFLISAGSLAAVVYIVRRAIVAWMARSQLPPVWREWAFWGLLTLLVGRYVLAGFEMQSHDILVVLLCALSLHAWSQSQDARAGLFAGLAAACKATPLLFAPVFLWQRRFRALACLVLALISATLLPDLVTPANNRVPWVVTWYNTFLHDIGPGNSAQSPGLWTYWNELNQCLAGTVHRLSVPPGPECTPNIPDVRIWAPSPKVLKATTMALQLGVLTLLGVALWPTRRPLTPDEQRFVRFGQGGVVVCAMLLLSPMSSKAHFAALVLPMAICVADFLYCRRDRLVGIGLVIVTVASSFTVKGIWGTAAGNLFLAYGSVCWSTVLCMLMTVRVVRHCGSPRNTPVTPTNPPPTLPPRRPCFLSCLPGRKRDGEFR